MILSGTSVSDSVGSLAEVREDVSGIEDSISMRFNMQAASKLGLTSTANDNLNWYAANLGPGLHAFWVDGNGKLINQPHGWGSVLMFIFNRNDMCQIFIGTTSKAYVRVTNSSTRVWNEWSVLN